MEKESFWEGIGGLILIIIIYNVFKFIRMAFYNYFYLKPHYHQYDSLREEFHQKDAELAPLMKKLGFKFSNSAFYEIREENVEFRKKQLVAISGFLDLPEYSSNKEIKDFLLQFNKVYGETKNMRNAYVNKDKEINNLRKKYKI